MQLSILTILLCTITLLVFTKNIFENKLEFFVFTTKIQPKRAEFIFGSAIPM